MLQRDIDKAGEDREIVWVKRHTEGGEIETEWKGTEREISGGRV